MGRGSRRALAPFLRPYIARFVELLAPSYGYGQDLVLHGHAGRFEGFIGVVPVYNVSVPVMGRDFWILKLSGEKGEPDGDV